MERRQSGRRLCVATRRAHRRQSLQSARTLLRLCHRHPLSGNFERGSKSAKLPLKKHYLPLLCLLDGSSCISHKEHSPLLPTRRFGNGVEVHRRHHSSIGSQCPTSGWCFRPCSYPLHTPSRYIRGIFCRKDKRWKQPLDKDAKSLLPAVLLARWLRNVFR